MMKIFFLIFALAISGSAFAETYFARIVGGVVSEVIAASPEIIATREGEWIQTWLDANGDQAKRYNYAGIGDAYDAQAGAFIAPKPYASWSIDTSTYRWVAPIPKPDGNYWWDEAGQAWRPMP